MNKIVIIALLAISMPAMSAGKYDGIWDSKELGYISLHENNGQIIVVRLEKDLGFWEASSGTLIGNTVRLNTIVSDVTSVIDVTLTSDTTYTATQVSCRPISNCQLPDGYTFTGSKIF